MEFPEKEKQIHLMKKNPGDYSNQDLLDLLGSDSNAAIDIIFLREFDYLCRIAYRVLKDSNQSEDIVQDVFYEFWKKRDILEVRTSIRAYLKRAVINKTLNFIRDQKIRLDDDSSLAYLDTKENIHLELEANEMSEMIDKALEELPPKCRMVFVLSRFEQLSYQEIADQMEISTKTVENHISKALKRLRAYLKPFLTLVLNLTVILLRTL